MSKEGSVRLAWLSWHYLCPGQLSHPEGSPLACTGHRHCFDTVHSAGAQRSPLPAIRKQFRESLARTQYGLGLDLGELRRPKINIPQQMRVSRNAPCRR